MRSSTPSPSSVQVRFWPILLVGFSVLLLALGVSGWVAYARATHIYRSISGLHDTEHETELALTNLRSDIAVSAILVRDALLDPKSLPSAREQSQKLYTEALSDLNRLSGLIPLQQKVKLSTLRTEVEQYWQSLHPLFAFESPSRSQFDYLFVETEILPRRRATLNVIGQIEQLNGAAFTQRRSEIDVRNAELARTVWQTFGFTAVLALAVAGLSLMRIRTLEHTASAQHQQVQAAEAELRRLSHQLVSAQEEERRALSRDLHDQVGQVLTALRISIGNLENVAASAGEKGLQELELSKRLVGQALRSSRDLAMGLRPTMLDDLGLGPALEWHARQHAKLCGVPVSLDLEGPLEQLSDAQKTCVYRIVQEALNNAAKYSQAKNIEVGIRCEGGLVLVNVKDDGIGLPAHCENGRGLGLLGMRERLTQIGGTLTIDSEHAKGTAISARFPLVQDVA